MEDGGRVSCMSGACLACLVLVWRACSFGFGFRLQLRLTSGLHEGLFDGLSTEVLDVNHHS